MPSATHTRRPSRSARQTSRRRKLRLLITAGPTREYIDSVRYISNDSSGQMGFALAAAAARRGHVVTLVHGPVAFPSPPGLRSIPVISAADMFRACKSAWPRQDGLIMAAAVADYTPRAPSHIKLKKSVRAMTLRLTPTADILAALSRNRRPRQIVIGFALEDRHERRNAESKLQRKNLDAIVLNRPAAIAAARAAQEILVRGKPWRVFASAKKQTLAIRLIRLFEQLCRGADSV